LRLLLEAGVPVGRGTDSVISVGELDPWSEAEAARLSAAGALRIRASGGARALSWDSELGSYARRKAADLAGLTRQQPNCPTAILTLVSGRIVHQISGS